MGENIVGYLRDSEDGNSSSDAVSELLAVSPTRDDARMKANDFYFEVVVDLEDGKRWSVRVDGFSLTSDFAGEYFDSVQDKRILLGFYCSVPDSFVKVMHCGECAHAARCELTEGRVTLKGDVVFSDDLQLHRPYFVPELEDLRAKGAWTMPRFGKSSKSVWVPRGERLTASEYKKRLYVEFNVRGQREYSLGMGESEVRVRLTRDETCGAEVLEVRSHTGGVRRYGISDPGRVALFSDSHLGHFMVLSVFGDVRVLAREPLLSPGKDRLFFEYPEDAPSFVCMIDPKSEAIISPHFASSPPALRAKTWGDILAAGAMCRDNGLDATKVQRKRSSDYHLCGSVSRSVSITTLLFEDMYSGWSISVRDQQPGLLGRLERRPGDESLYMLFGDWIICIREDLPSTFGVAVVHGLACSYPCVMVFDAGSPKGHLLCRIPLTSEMVKAMFPHNTRRHPQV